MKNLTRVKVHIAISTQIPIQIHAREPSNPEGAESGKLNFESTCSVG